MDPRLKYGIERIVSGGQTGADRAALDWAIEHDIPHGGWCPKGRWAEDGRIGDRYQLRETPSVDLSERTEWNVRDSDATLIITGGPVLEGGSLATARFASDHGKPCFHMADPERDIQRLGEFLDAYRPKVLNVAGPRLSKSPEIVQIVKRVLDILRDA
jgi:hypothetical protein